MREQIAEKTSFTLPVSHLRDLTQPSTGNNCHTAATLKPATGQASPA
ncbi:hypothetical protein [Pseudomonas chlororaphis]|nr:hypothetical protein [Pseudomonas chlororaphis]